MAEAKRTAAPVTPRVSSDTATPRPPILSDVAAAAHVSMTTASRALDPNSEHPVKLHTRERVQAAAARLAYQPNPMARALRARRSPTIAVVVHDVSDPYFAEIVRGATHAASTHGFLTVVCNSDRDPATELRYVQMLCLSRVAGVLFAGGGLEEPAYRRELRGYTQSIGEYGGAIVALAPRAEAWAAEIPDNRGGARMVTEHLLSLGHRSIAMIGGPPYIRTSRERELGYRAAMEAAGAAPWVTTADFSRSGGASAMQRVLARRERRTTAVFVATDSMALGALSELRRRGVDVPDDLSVAGFDDIPGLDFVHPSLTTVRVPMAAIGAAGVSRLFGLFDGKPGRPRVRVHPVELVVRDSTSAPRLRRASRARA
ncbi:MAG TPA: LacI family DNA-binding transcriptional regulator [Candidatus Saccharimonadales bacterium]|nr:LacI family DNA-binding transcriptional regulator [Candidatus Saccharimonadales bacterium]